MQLKFILRRDDGSRAQLAMTADATASVGDLAVALAASDPERRGARRSPTPTLKLEHSAFESGTLNRVLDPKRSLLDAGVRSGSTVSLATAAPATGPSAAARGRAVAILRVLTGPDAGREFSLPSGTSVVGTGLTADVVLSDGSITAAHASISVGESIEINSLVGPSGLSVGGRPTARLLAGVTDVVNIGASSFGVTRTVRPGTTQSDSPVIEFNRSPRVVSRFEERVLPAPRPPQLPEPAHLPIASMMLPVVLGLVLLAVTRSLVGVVFVALSPLLMVGMYFDVRWQASRRHQQQARNFADAVRTLATDVTAAQKVERAVRCSETPALPDVVDAIHRLGPLLWTHRPEHPDFLCVRLGLGDAPSRCRTEVSTDGDADPKYRGQLSDLVEEFELVADVPVVADLRECGALGVCGPRGLVDGVARGIVMQLIGLHSPAELTLAAFASPQSRASWEWLEWLPHCGGLHSPLGGNHLSDNVNGGIALLSRLEDLVKKRAEAAPSSTPADVLGPIPADRALETAPAIVPSVVVLVEDTTPVDRARLTRLAERGPRVGVYVVWVATAVTSLPGGCRSFLLVDHAQSGSSVGEIRHGRHVFPVACDSLDVPVAEQVALLLAPVVDIGAAVTDETDLPRSVPFLTIAGHRLATDPNTVVQHWVSNGSVTPRHGQTLTRTSAPSNLRALVGSTGADDFYLDLREQGPHALVGGTTGSGKSEFLQTWVLGMAAAHSPDRVTFLLVDYKGGAAFAECLHLPHTVGLVTDLSPHLVRRSLTSLRAELHHRERLLNRKRVKDLATLEQSGDPDTPPSLVIVIDEFAALASEVPEFVDGVIDVAQRGRSLGLHLIMATQRPAGVIKDNLRANTNLRIALRLNDVDDSLDVIDDPAAAFFAPELPGRAVAKTGPGRLTSFQSAYVGGWSGDAPERAPIDLSEFAFGRRRAWTAAAEVGGPTSGVTDITRIVDNVRTAARKLAIPTPRKPWLPPLDDVYPLEALVGSGRAGELVLGRGDDPAAQSQPVAGFLPDEQGNMAVLGTGGSGKSTALRTAAISAAMNPGGGPVHVYGFDFGSGSLRMLEGLPHVAAIVDGDDDERIGRVLRRLTGVLERRSRAFAGANAATLTDYRTLAGRPDEPRILLLVDGIGAFRDTYEHTVHSPNYGMFSQLATDGRMLGLHLVVAGDRPAALSSALASTIQRRLVLRLSTEDDYLLAGVPTDVLGAASPRGRGLLDGQEVQLAVLGGDTNVAAQGLVVAQLAELMRQKGYQPPEPVERLADFVPLDGLPAASGTGMPIGVADTTLTPLELTPRGTLMVTGPPGSGRTTALLTLAQAMRRFNPTARMALLSPAPSTLAGIGMWTDTAIGATAVIELANDLMNAVARGTVGRGNLMVVIESIGDFGGGEAESELARLVKTAVDASMFVVGESEVSTWSQAWQLGQPFKSARRGLLLAPGGVEADTLLSTTIGTVRRHDFPPGRAVLIDKGKGVWLQIAHPSV